MFPIYQWYLFKSFAKNFITIFVGTLITIFVTTATSDEINAYDAILMGIVAIDEIAPFIFFFASLSLFMKLSGKRELVALRSISISKLSIAKPIMFFVLMFSVFYICVYHGYIKPSLENSLLQDSDVKSPSTDIVVDMIFKDGTGSDFKIVSLHNIAKLSNGDFEFENGFIIFDNGAKSADLVKIERSQISKSFGGFMQIVGTNPSADKYAFKMQHNVFSHLFSENLIKTKRYSVYELPFMIRHMRGVGINVTYLTGVLYAIFKNVALFVIAAMLPLIVLFSYNSRGKKTIQIVLTMISCMVGVFLLDGFLISAVYSGNVTISNSILQILIAEIIAIVIFMIY